MNSSIIAATLIIISCSSPVLSEDCPQGFIMSHSRCLLISLTASVTWCDANWACARAGAELLNSWDLISSLRDIIPLGEAWIGVSDMARDRNRSLDGWQLVNGRGLMPNNSSVWKPGDPNNSGGNQDCLMQTFDANNVTGLIDKQCNHLTGYVCEMPTVAGGQTGIESCGVNGRRSRWSPAPDISGAPEFYNSPEMYCHWDSNQIASIRDCITLAAMRSFARSVLFNAETLQCQVVEFTDSQTELELETGNWTKFVRE